MYDPDALQITQETEDLMIQQITRQTAQQAPPLPITNQEINQQELHARVDTAKESFFMAKKMPADKPNRKGGNGFAISMEKLSLSESSYNEDDDEDDDDADPEEAGKVPVSGEKLSLDL